MKIKITLLVIFLSCIAAGIYTWNIPTRNQDTVRVDIKPGSSLSAVARQWQSDGWLVSADLLKLQAKLLKKEHVLRAGEFDIPASLTGPKLLAFLASAKPVSYKVQFIEGTTLTQAIESLKKAKSLKQDVQPLTHTTIAQLIGLQGNPEGWLYPDTYVYHSGEAVSSIILQSYQRMKKVLQQEWQNKASNLPYSTPYDALVMASIVEKETGAAHERPQIAGVFVRRLQKNMRLETDPTIIYGLGDSFDGNLKKKHLRDRSNKYNSYRHKGLPPSPIAFAGRSAIHAALHPQDGKTLYFVAKGDGSHYFSATLAEHNKAVRKYQIFRRKKEYRSAPQTN
ncbi:endolytic transglycosylase MltG [Bacterioplanoides sp.]|uniref:endolytic transglycosylase MltG n=1 Tax=Bacterioplanoides sp. TaxID=2066072 RepID=UPI003B5A4557